MGGRVAVLVSGSGTNLQSLLDDPEVRPHVVLVVSDRPGVRAIDRAEHANVPVVVLAPDDKLDPRPDRDAYSGAMADLLHEQNIDLIVSAGFMRVLGRDVVKPWANRWLNVHPALLPSFPGMHGVADALEHGARVTGVTVHFVDEEVDHGPIVFQESLEIRQDETLESLEERVHEIEHRLLPAAVRALIEGRLHVSGRNVSIDPPA